MSKLNNSDLETLRKNKEKIQSIINDLEKYEKEELDSLNTILYDTQRLTFNKEKCITIKLIFYKMMKYSFFTFSILELFLFLYALMFFQISILIIIFRTALNAILCSGIYFKSTSSMRKMLPKDSLEKIKEELSLKNSSITQIEENILRIHIKISDYTIQIANINEQIKITEENIISVQQINDRNISNMFNELKLAMINNEININENDCDTHKIKIIKL